MKVGEINVEMKVDASELEQALERLRAAMEAVQAAVKAVNDASLTVSVD